MTEDEPTTAPLPGPAEQGAWPGDFGHVTPEAVTWVVSAVGSGVLGNAAYDWLKKSFAAMTGKRRYRRLGRLAHGEMIAALAVQARCGELGHEVPDWAALRCTQVADGPAGTTICVECGGLRATVVIPPDPLSSAPAVTLYLTP